MDSARLLRECAVDLVRASDLTGENMLRRVKQVQADLEQVVFDTERRTRLLRAEQAAARLRSVA